MTDAKDIDYKRLFKTLTVAAASLLRGEERSVDMGAVGAQDLAQETLDAFLNSSNLLGWTSAKGTQEKFLCGVLANKFKSHHKRDKKIAGSLDDPDWGFNPLARGASPERAAQSKELEGRLCQAVGNDRDLRDLIAAVEWTTGAHAVNQELAKILDKTEPQIVNLKRRLMNNQKVCELLGIAHGKRQAV